VVAIAAGEDGALRRLRTLHAVSDAADDVPTGEPDQDLVDEVTGDDEAATETETVPTGEPDEELVAEAAADDAPPDVVDGDLTALVAEVAGARSDIAGVQVGVDSMLADLAATARDETVGAGLAGLRTALDEMVRLTRRADEHVAELHGENQRLRAGELATATLPMIRDLVRLHDEVAQLTSASHPEAQADLQLVVSRLLDTLARWGLTPFEPATGEKLDARQHQGVGRVASSDGEPGTIASVRRPGFAHDDGRTFRAAEVEVFTAPPPPPADPPADGQTEET
jgi:molecular chaperone GrpE (heat shock protein)